MSIITIIYTLASALTHGYNPATIRPLSHTYIGTPIIPLPKPYGTSKKTMTLLLEHIHAYLRGGSKLSKQQLENSIDDNHLHGSFIGHYPDSKQPHWKPNTEYNFNNETIEMKEKAHEHARFNKQRSNSLPLDREIPDIRNVQCKKQWYYNDSIMLPNVSIIIIFYNEQLSTLLRSIHSVLNRTPRNILHEIILVDDGSDENAPWLLYKQSLEQHIQLLPKTYLVKLTERNGLMFARNTGGFLSTGKILVFLDSHIEVTKGYIEPLVGRIVENNKNVVVPVIDNINADTFEYYKGGIDILGHTWGLNQIGILNDNNLNLNDNINPMITPIMAGGLLGISRTFFIDDLGMYDPLMKVWGGEEMELSFRIWLCGGIKSKLECLPCSHIGHVFRSSKYWKGQVYKVNHEIIKYNKIRASFWMDKFSELSNLSLQTSLSNDNNMEFYKSIKKRLDCKPFSWYLKNVNTQLLKSLYRIIGNNKDIDNSNSMNNMFQSKGYVKNNITGTCLDQLHLKQPGAPFGIYPCHGLGGSQSMVFSNTGLIMPGDRLTANCLTRDRYDDHKIKQYSCTDNINTQVWNMSFIDNKNDSVLIRSAFDGKCLGVVLESDDLNISAYSLKVMVCGGDLQAYQEWHWETLIMQDEGNKDSWTV